MPNIPPSEIPVIFRTNNLNIDEPTENNTVQETQANRVSSSGIPLTHKQKIMKFFSTLKQRVIKSDKEEVVRATLGIVFPAMIGSGISLCSTGIMLPVGITMLTIGLIGFVTLKLTQKKTSVVTPQEALTKEQETLKLQSTNQLIEATEMINHGYMTDENGNVDLK